MRLLNVLVTAKLDEECFHQIADLSPELRVTDVSDLIQAEYEGDFSSKDKLDIFLAKADIIYGLQGRATMWIEDRGEFTLIPGVFIVVPKGLRHRTYDVEEELRIYDVFTPPMF